MPLLRDDLGVSSAVDGLHGTALATGSGVAGLVFAPLSAQVGRAAAGRRTRTAVLLVPARRVAAAVGIAISREPQV